jgi:hypothetical protein
MKYFLLIIPLLIWAFVWIYSEINICRHGGDVFDWTKKLVKWLDNKEGLK